MIKHNLLFVSLLLTVGCTFGERPGDSPAVADKSYEPTWESLKTHADPEWFLDAKFGIYCHWGPYCVPAFENEWYSRNMYRENSSAYKHHLKTYGHPSKFGYKDFIPMFTAEKFDADEWARLFKKAGARFGGPVSEHADGFALWDSAVTEWDAADMGPRRDIVGELAAALRKQDIKFIATFHHGWNWDWYPVNDKRYDCSDPRYAGLYGQPHANGVKPNKSFNEEWKAKVMEVIDKYRPDLIWFDSRLKVVDEDVRQSLVAFYYNKEVEWGRQVAVTYKNQDLPGGTGIVDIERGRMNDLTPFPWLNDDAIDWNSWCYIQNPRYKSIDRLVDGLVDIVSKNGNLLLNFGPKPNGEIPEPVRDRLLGIGQWLDVNGEAIYGTRPWRMYGEGPTKVKAGHFGEKDIKVFTAEDIRFTTKGDVLYAIVLAWPGDGQTLTIRSLAAGGQLGSIQKVELLGHDGRLKWTCEPEGLKIDMPMKAPCENAFALRITSKK